MARASSITVPSMMGIVDRDRAPAVDEKVWCYFFVFVCLFFVTLSNQFVITETLWSSEFSEQLWCHCIEEGLWLCTYIQLFLWTLRVFRGKFTPQITIFLQFFCDFKSTLIKPQRWNLAWGCGPGTPFPKPNFGKKSLKEIYPFWAILYQKLPILAILPPVSPHL